MKRCMVILVVGVLTLAGPASSTIINVPGDQPTIQAGIDASADGDTVLVQPGTYVENINFYGHNIVLASLFLITGDTSFISTTIVDGNQSGSVVTFESGEGGTTVITGFTMQNGFLEEGNGGGIHCSFSNPTISHNIISGNTAEFNGGGIFCHLSDATITNNTISENSAFGGGGMHCYNSDAPISNNIISGNGAYWGGAIDCAYSNPTIINNTITGNSAAAGGGFSCWYSNPTITNTILWGDTAPDSPEIYISSGSPVITYCDIQGGWEGEGNIDCDPAFCDPDADNYSLADASCCLGSGESGVDIGAYGIGCWTYIPGDVNHNGIPLELDDVIAMIANYRGIIPPYYNFPCPPHGEEFAATADPNGNCVAFELGDVVTEVAAYQGSDTVSGCPDCPGLGILPGDEVRGY